MLAWINDICEFILEDIYIVNCNENRVTATFADVTAILALNRNPTTPTNSQNNLEINGWKSMKIKD